MNKNYYLCRYFRDFHWHDNRDNESSCFLKRISCSGLFFFTVSVFIFAFFTHCLHKPSSGIQKGSNDAGGACSVFCCNHLSCSVLLSCIQQPDTFRSTGYNFSHHLFCNCDTKETLIHLDYS